MSANLDLERRIAEAYRWHRRLGARVIATPHCHVVTDSTKPQVWDCNHADDVSARDDAEIDKVFAAMDRHLAHTQWRAVHTDGFTPGPFIARLAFDDFRECPLVILMALYGETSFRGAPPSDIRLVESEKDWEALSELVRTNHVEGRSTGGLNLEPETTAAIVYNYRAKSPTCQFYLVFDNGAAIACAACAAAPNGLGIIEDVFTHPLHRCRGVSSALITSLVARLRKQGCGPVFIGALAEEKAKWLYARLGFSPVSYARGWVKDVSKSAR